MQEELQLEDRNDLFDSAIQSLKDWKYGIQERIAKILGQ